MHRITLTPADGYRLLKQIFGDEPNPATCYGGPVPPPNPTPVTLDGLKRELADIDARKAKLESMISLIEAQPGVLELLQEISRR